MKNLLKQLLYINLALFLVAFLVVPAAAEKVQRLEYILTLHKNDGSEVIEQEAKDAGESFSLANYLFERDSHVQVAWAEEANGEPTQRLDALYVPATSTDLYAFWLEIEEAELGSGVVVLNGLKSDLDSAGTFYKKKAGAMTLPEELYGEKLLAWSTQVQPEEDVKGVLCGQWYVGGQIVTPELNEIVSLYGQPVGDGIYVIYDPNGGAVANGGSVVVQKAQNGKTVTLIGEDFFEAADNDTLVGWSTERKSVSPDYYVGADFSICGTQPKVLYAIWEHQPVFSNYISNNDATCMEDGTMTAVCDDGCGMEDTVIDKGSALGHAMSAWVQTKVPTCTEKGEEKQSCANCEHFVVREVIATGHLDSDKDYYCDICEVALCVQHVYDAVAGYVWSSEECVAIQLCSICGGGRKETNVTFELTENELLMSHVPSNLMVLIAAYEEGQMTCAILEEAAERISYHKTAAEIRVYFLETGTFRPLMKCLNRNAQ